MIPKTDRRVRELIRLRRLYGMTTKAMAAIGGVHPSHWRNVENGWRVPGLDLLDAVARTFGGSVEVVYDHHAPFLELDPAEAYEVLRLVQHYRAGVPQPSEVLVTTAGKLEKHTRGRVAA